MTARAMIFIGIDAAAFIWCCVALLRQDGRGVLMSGGAIAALWLLARSWSPA